MFELANKNVVVIGLGGRGRAACELLCRVGARVWGVDAADNAELREQAGRLQGLGVQAALGVAKIPPGDFNLAVISPAVPPDSPIVQALRARQVPVISELELAFQQAHCLSIAIGGTNGKGTTAGLVERVLRANHRKTLLAGHQGLPACTVADQTKDVDFLILQVNAMQLEATQLFRPSVAVLLNLAADYRKRYAAPADYARASARLFSNQQAFDWAIVQSDAMARLQELHLSIPAKTITFSASDPKADLYLDRGLLVSALPNWPGPLLDTDRCQLRGPHNAENLMAALAVGHALRLPLETMAEALQTCPAGPHRFELVAEINGVQFINDSKATNVDALQKSLQGTRVAGHGQPNVWLIAGGQDVGGEFHFLGPLLAQRVKQAFLVGQAAEKIRAAWSLFTPCTLADSLLEAVAEAAKNATSGDVVLLSPACSSFDQFRNYQDRGERFCRAVKSIAGGVPNGHPNINGKIEEVGNRQI